MGHVHVFCKKSCGNLLFCFSVICYNYTTSAPHIPIFSLKFTHDTYWLLPFPNIFRSLSLFILSKLNNLLKFLFPSHTPLQQFPYPQGYAYRRLKTAGLQNHNFLIFHQFGCQLLLHKILHILYFPILSQNQDQVVVPATFVN